MTGPRSDPPIPMLTTFRIRFPVWPFQRPSRTRVANAWPSSVPDAGRELGHAVEHRVHFGDHVLAVDENRLVAGRPEGHVEHRAVLGHVDLLAAEHGVDALAQPGLLGELDEETERLVGHAVLRVVEVQADALDRQALAATRVVGEELAEMDVADPRVMVAQR